MSNKFKFRGYDNPVIEGTEVYYGEGIFTVGEVYSAVEIKTYPLSIPDAQFKGDNGEVVYEELVFFDEVIDD